MPILRSAPFRILRPLAWAAFSLKFLPWAWAWVFLGLGLLSLAEAGRGRGGRSSTLWINAGVSLLIVAAFEGALSFRDSLAAAAGNPVRGEHLYDSRADTLLGYSPMPDTRRRMTKSFAGEPIYDVSCTIGSNGLRVSPPTSEVCQRSLLFFGGSFMFGEGVGDEETMPYTVGRLAGGRYRIYNFAVHGYGPQHMLAQVEQGRVAAVVEEPPEAAFYWCLYPEHVFRLPGRRPWTRIGPKYVLEEDGRVVFAGRFEGGAPPHPVLSWIRRQAAKSAFGRRALAYTPPITREEERLFLGVLDRSQRLLSSDYPGIRFHILLSGGDEELIDSLRARRFFVHSVDSILGESGLPAEEIRLHAADTHPSARAHRLVAHHVMRSALEENARSDGPFGVD